MPLILYRIISMLIGYAFGNISFGYLYGKYKNINLQKEGSGNIGTTNTLRVLGVKAGAVTLICDCMKAVLAALLVWAIFAQKKSLTGEDLSLLRLYAAFGAMIGHDFPIVLKFHGGKGVASGLGFLIVSFPQAIPVALGIFVLTVLITRYVSLGSILAAFSVFLQVWIFYALGWFPYDTYWIEAGVFISLMAFLVIVLHHGNIHRLIHHNENKFTFHPKVKTSESQNKENIDG